MMIYNMHIGTTRPDHTVLRSLVALLASLPATENKHFREEFDTVMLISVKDPICTTDNTFKLRNTRTFSSLLFWLH